VRLLLLSLIALSCVAAEPVAATDRPTLTDAQVEALVWGLIARSGDDGWAATAAAIRESPDPRFIPPLVDMLRFGEHQTHVGALLDELTGLTFGVDWPGWVEELGAHPRPVPPGYAPWKATLLIIATGDHDFRRFFPRDVPTRVRLDEVVWGGVLVDGIPALEQPATIPGTEADWMTEDELVAGVSLGGVHRAYPLRIIDWHEMVNDTVGGRPVSLAYCTLCGAAVLYDTTVGETTYTFGSSGLLMRSNKLMFDRQTDSLWNQLTGEPVTGSLAHSGVVLERLPVVITEWSQWRQTHPDTDILSLETGHVRDYTPGAPYADYFASDQLMFPVWQRRGQLPDKSRVLATVLDGVPVAWPMGLFDDDVARVRNDRLGTRDVVVVAGEGALPAIRLYDGTGEAFLAVDGGDLLQADGVRWRITEEALVGPDGQKLPRLGGHLAYWFGWVAYYPKTVVVGL